MKIEDMTSDNIKELPDIELRNLKIRFSNIYDRHFVDPEMMKAVDLTREMFYDKYIILRIEMKRRKVTCIEGVALDKQIDPRIFQKSVWGIDIPSLGSMMIVRSYVALSGAFIKSPLGVKNVEVVIRNLEKNRDERLENKLTMIIKQHMGKVPKFTYSPPGPDSSYIPLFDLVLRPREDAKKQKPLAKVKLTKKTVPKEKIEKTFPIQKPEESEETIRIPVGPDCEVTATITIDKDQGIKALYCGKIKKIRTYLFDKKVKAWTMASARAWIKEQSAKTEKALGEGQGVGGPRQGVGGAEICVCPKCGHEEEHKRDEPCAKIECPKCGTPMKGKAQKVAKKLSEAQQKDYDEETALIRENAKKAKYPHKFEAAKWTWPNGHPRCIHCGDEEMVDKNNKSLPCERPITKFIISKIDKKQQIVGGVVYEPDEIDTQGDYTDKKEIEKAMYRFMEKYATNTKRIRINHQGKKIFFPIVESFIPEHDTMKGDQRLKAGTWWLMIKITNEKIWNEIEKGELTGFSMGGKAKNAS